MNVDFWHWVKAEMVGHRLTFRAIERAAGLSNGAISKRALDSLPPTQTTCQALAQALDYPLELVLRQAGILPPADDDYVTRLAEILRELPVAEQQEIYEYARYRRCRRQLNLQESEAQ